MTRDDLYKKALETYGLEAQLDMLVEEMSELTKEVCKRKRGRANDLQILQEVADVEIMLEQLKRLFPAGSFSMIKDEKLKRLEKRLQEHTDA